MVPYKNKIVSIPSLNTDIKANPKIPYLTLLPFNTSEALCFNSSEIFYDTSAYFYNSSLFILIFIVNS